jgi:hypothetical protein
MPCAAIAAREQCVLARRNARSDGSFDHVGVHLDPAVVEEHDQAGPMSDRIAHCLGQIRNGGDAIDMRVQPGVQRVDDRPTSLVAHLSSVLGGMAADLGLGRIEPRMRPSTSAANGDLVETQKS